MFSSFFFFNPSIALRKGICFVFGQMSETLPVGLVPRCSKHRVSPTVWVGGFSFEQGWRMRTVLHTHCQTVVQLCAPCRLSRLPTGQVQGTPASHSNSSEPKYFAETHPGDAHVMEVLRQCCLGLIWSSLNGRAWHKRDFALLALTTVHRAAQLSIQQ